jgi:hypothetical protein
MVWVSVKVSPGRILVLLGCQVAGFLSLLPPVRAKCARTIYRSNSIMAAIHPKRKYAGSCLPSAPFLKNLANPNHNAFPAPSP